MVDIAYKNLVNEIISDGVWRKNRTGIDALTIPHYHIQHDMSKGFPLLTTKKMSLRTIAVELEGFLKGITDKNWYKVRACKIWNEWCNPQAADRRIINWQNENANKYKVFRECVEESNKLRKDFQKAEFDLGPIYGYQWRQFGEQYGEVRQNGVDKGNDQLASIIKSIEKNPNDRRMVCSAWNPNQINQMALPPCHILWKVNVLGDKLHLCWFQRSCDTALGIPYNIASYALLQLLLCKQFGYQPGKLSGFLDDVHIYRNHVDKIKEQIEREPKELCSVDIAHLKPFSFQNEVLNIDWTHKDLAVFDYESHDAIQYEVAV